MGAKRPKNGALRPLSPSEWGQIRDLLATKLRVGTVEFDSSKRNHIDCR